MIISKKSHPLNTEAPWQRLSLHGMPPQTERTTHYFGGVTSEFRLDHAAFDGPALGNYIAVRNRDLDALGEVEKMLDRGLDSSREISALKYAGCIRVSRLLAAQINAERG